MRSTCLRSLATCSLTLLTASTVLAEDRAPRRGWSPQGLPLVNYTSDDGLGYGARVMLVDFGTGAERPYRYSITGQFFQTTRQTAAHRLILDAPDLGGSPLRVGLELAYYATKFNQYYGQGNDRPYDADHDACDDREALSDDPDLCPGNPEFRGLRYYSYDDRTFPRVLANLDLKLGGPFRAALRYTLRVDSIRPRYSREDLGQTGPSRFIEDAREGRVLGYDGGAAEELVYRTGELRLLGIFDTRDDELAPVDGMFHELALISANPATGSAVSFYGLGVTARFYRHLIPGYRRLVGALRLRYEMLEGDVPVHLKPFVGGVFWTRGVPVNWVIGNVLLLGNAELRFTPVTFWPLDQQVDVTLAAGVDAGRVWSDARFLDGGGLTMTAAGGLRIAWNRAFVVRVDYGRGLTQATSGFYLEFNHLF